MTTPLDPQDLQRAAAAVDTAQAILVTAGAGMGVDSGLPDFRGPEGFWRAYPPYRALGLRFEELADPRWFDEDPRLAWGFYGHRLNLYRATRPHAGFTILRRWAEAAPDGWFVFTSNVDGQFQRAGFDAARVVECHGAIDWLQCTQGCGAPVIRADGVAVEVDPATFRAVGPLPTCRCGALARPNILMFGDWGWDGARTSTQEDRLEQWLAGLDRDRLVVIECGAGTAIPTVRRLGEQLAGRGAVLVRINPREPSAPTGAISFASGARAAVEAIDALRSQRPR